MISRLKRFWARAKRRSRITAAKSTKAPLREFVYLDEVSVYSLLTSRQGALASEFTDTRTSTITGELAGVAGFKAPAFAKAEASSKFSKANAKSSQVVRKSTIQAAFKELREGEEGKLAILSADFENDAPSFKSLTELKNSVHELQAAKWAISQNSLARGQLVELAVDVEADQLYKATSAISAIVSIFDQKMSLLRPSDKEAFEQVAAISEVFDKLIAGLVPLKCRVRNYRTVTLANETWLVHRRILDAMAGVAIEQSDIYLVGVAVESLFWKDIRRVLFSKSEYRVLCRLTHQGLKDSWVPVKLGDVLSILVPDLASSLDAFNRSLVDGNAPVSFEKAERIRSIETALCSYGNLLAGSAGVSLPGDCITYFSRSRVSNFGDFDLQSERRRAFRAVETYVAETLSVEVDPLRRVELRAEALAAAGLDEEGNLINRRSDSEIREVDPTPSLIEAEFVAIYW